MGVSRADKGKVVCPLCLLEYEFCPTFRLVDGLRFEDTVKDGITKSVALHLRHPELCQNCKKPLARCYRRLAKKKLCIVRSLRGDERFPHWYRAEDYSKWYSAQKKKVAKA